MIKNVLNKLFLLCEKIYVGLFFKINKLNRYGFVKNSKRGAILIEFAFSVPVLFSLIYYGHDLAKISQFKQRVNFSLHCAANMFQNTSNITAQDYCNVARAASLVLHRKVEKEAGLCQFSAAGVTGTAENSCLVNWLVWGSEGSLTEPPKDNYYYSPNGQIMHAVSSSFYGKGIYQGSEYQTNKISQNLTIHKNEMKVVLELSYKHTHDPDNSRSAAGTLVYAMKPVDLGLDRGYGVLYRSQVIFTPKPGTFNPNNPPQ